jgi:hypothetical protein
MKNNKNIPNHHRLLFVVKIKPKIGLRWIERSYESARNCLPVHLYKGFHHL